MGWVAPVLTGISALGGALSNRSQKQTSMPTVAPEYQPLQNLLIDLNMKRLGQPSALPTGYEATGLQDILRSYNAARLRASNELTARGLSTSPVAGAVMTNLDTARAGQNADFLNSLPLLDRRLRMEDILQGMNMLRTGTGQEVTSPGNMLGGAFSDAGGMLGFLYGKGAFGKKSTAVSV